MNEQAALKEALSLAIEGKYDEAIAKGGIVLEGLQELERLRVKQSPMKPIVKRISAGSCGMTYETYQCPNCNHGSIMVGNYKDKVDYCHDCGQAIDWSDK